MPLIFLFYAFCALTTCPRPVLRDTSPATPCSVKFNFFRTRKLPSDESAVFPSVSTSLGIIQGRFTWSRDHRKLAAFEGIPYALAPVGRLRFRDPVPLGNSPWKGVLVANKTGEDCLQLDFTRSFRVRGDENCLFLNVYIPAENLNKEASLPVLILIPGGAFISGSGSLFGPEYLLDKDIILVTFNYRVGVLGFLSTGDNASRGNFGMKDQLTVIKWVVDHISSFGGNSNKITLIGESAGATSIALHLISPLTSSQIPRLNGAILLSPSKLNYIERSTKETFSSTKSLAKRMKCPTDKSQDLFNCLRSRDPFMVVGQTYHLWKIPVFFLRLLFGPVIEENHEGAFLVASPQQAYVNSSSKVMPVPVISGVTKDEGSFFAATIHYVPFLWQAISAHWEAMMGYLMQYDNIAGVNATQVSRKIAKFYFSGKKKWSYDNLDGISKVLGDSIIYSGAHSFLQLHSQVAPTYAYLFSHYSNLNSIKYLGITSDEWGVAHTAELPLIFPMDAFYGEERSADDLQISRFLIQVIANFAEEGKPLPNDMKVDWNPVLNTAHMEVLEIKKETRIIHFPYLDRIQFWEDLQLRMH